MTIPASAEAELPPYDGIRLADVTLVKTPEQAAAARDALLAADAIGFDTESKPTFTKGEVSTGPHLIQFATDQHAYLFQVGAETDAATLALLQAILEPATPQKIGFGLSDDVKRLYAKLAIRAGGVVDLSVALRTPGQRNDLGAKTAVAKFFGRKLQKSKKISTTNWSLPRLNDQQLLYAADDAQVALRVYRQWLAEGGQLKPMKAVKLPRPPRVAHATPPATATSPAITAAAAAAKPAPRARRAPRPAAAGAKPDTGNS